MEIPSEAEYLEYLPDEILEMILQHVPEEEYHSVAKTQRRLHDITTPSLERQKKKHIENLIYQYFLHNRPSLSRSDVTPKKMMELGLLNNNLSLVLEAIDLGENLTPTYLFQYEDYMTDSTLNKKVKLIQKLLGRISFDEEYVVYVLEMISDHLSRGVLGDRLKNLFVIAEMFLQHGLCISPGRSIKLKAPKLKNRMTTEYQNRLNRLIKMSRC